MSNVVFVCDAAGGVSGAAEDKIVCFTFSLAPAEIAERARLTIPKAGIDALALRPDQRIFAAGGWDGRVRVFHYGKAKPLTILKVAFCSVRVAMHENSTLPADTSLPNGFEEPNKSPSLTQHPLDTQYHTAAVTGLAFAKDGNMLASCSRDSTIALWRVF